MTRPVGGFMVGLGLLAAILIVAMELRPLPYDPKRMWR